MYLEQSPFQRDQLINIDQLIGRALDHGVELGDNHHQTIENYVNASLVPRLLNGQFPATALDRLVFIDNMLKEGKSVEDIKKILDEERKKFLKKPMDLSTLVSAYKGASKSLLMLGSVGFVVFLSTSVFINLPDSSFKKSVGRPVGKVLAEFIREAKPDNSNSTDPLGLTNVNKVITINEKQEVTIQKTIISDSSAPISTDNSLITNDSLEVETIAVKKILSKEITFPNLSGATGVCVLALDIAQVLSCSQDQYWTSTAIKDIADTSVNTSLSGLNLTGTGINVARIGNTFALTLTNEAIASIAGVKNNGGDIAFVAGAGVTITASDANNTITFNLAGSGVNADLLDSVDSTQFLRSDTSDNFTFGTLTLDAGTTLNVLGTFTCTNCVGDAAIPDTITASNYLPLAGGTMAGNINFNNNLATNIGAAGTNFTAGGGLNLAGAFDAASTIQLGSQNQTLDTPAAGVISTSGDLRVVGNDIQGSGAVSLIDLSTLTLQGSTGWTTSQTFSVTGVGDVLAGLNVNIANACCDVGSSYGVNVVASSVSDFIYGLKLDLTSTFAAANDVFGVYVGITGNNSFALDRATGIYINNPVSVGSIWNKKGLRIAAISGGTTSNFAIYSEGGNSVFAGSIGIGSLTNPTNALDVTGVTTVGAGSLANNKYGMNITATSNVTAAFSNTYALKVDTTTAGSAQGLIHGIYVGLTDSNGVGDTNYGLRVSLGGTDANGLQVGVTAGASNADANLVVSAKGIGFATCGDITLTGGKAAGICATGLNSSSNYGAIISGSSGATGLRAVSDTGTALQASISGASGTIVDFQNIGGSVFKIDRFGQLNMNVALAGPTCASLSNGDFGYDSSNTRIFWKWNGTCSYWNRTGTFDIAERAVASESLEAGDVLAIDTAATDFTVKKSSTPYQKTLLGIESTDPTFIDNPDSLGNPQFVAKIALAGRVPVKVSTENGPISAGDPLTSSSNPGLAMKQTQPGPTIGKALETFACDQTTATSEVACFGKILVFVQGGYWAPPLNGGLPTSLTGLENISTADLVAINISTDNLVVTNSITLGANLIKLDSKGQLEILGSINLVGDLTISKTLFAQSVETTKLKTTELSLEASGGSVGTAKIASGTTKVTIPTNLVKSTSRIFVTALNFTSGQALVVTEKQAGSFFVVEVEQPSNHDISFDWFIVN